MRISVSVAALLTSLCASVLAAQQQPAPPPSGTPQALEPPPVTFRIEVNYVEVDASVTDARGNPVTDLTTGDFEVLEDGRPQTVTAFSIVNLPVEKTERPLFAPAPIEPDVQTNTTAEGRIYLIVLDDLHTTFSNTARVRKALRAFIERNLGANDRAAVVYTSGTGGGQDFTSSRRLLIDAVEKFSGRKLRLEALETTGRVNQFGNSTFGGATDPREAERAHHARTAMDAVRQIAEFMQGVRGRRKAMLFVSEGISYDVEDVIRNTSATAILQEVRDAIAAATRANVAIYAIDPRGLSASDEAIEAGGAPPDSPGVSVVRGLQDSLRRSQESLRVLATETGGSAVLNRNDLSEAFARVVRENSTYYVLGYYSTNERRDGRFRRLDVRVRRPGLQVRSRRGYVAPRGRSLAPRAAAAAPGESPLMARANEALASPLPVSGIPMKVFAAAYTGVAPTASVALAIEMRADGFRFTEKEDTLADTLAVTFIAVDAAGRTQGGGRHIFALAMKADNVARTRERGFRVVSQVDLPPGQYQLRIAAAEEGGNRAGSVVYDLGVPDFYGPAFSMSGVSLTSASAAATPTVRPKDLLGDLLPSPPAAARQFERDEMIMLFAEFYENARNAPPHRLDLSTTMRAEDGRVVFEDRQERSSTDLQGGTGGYGYAVQIPLGGFAAGTYVIHVEGQSRAGGAEAGVGRDVMIRIQ